MSCLLNLPNCILIAVPWWIWAVLAVIVLGVVAKLFGWKWVPAIAGLFLVLLFGDRALQQGYAHRRREEDAQQGKAGTVVDQAKDAAKADSDKQLQQGVDKWTGR